MRYLIGILLVAIGVYGGFFLAKAQELSTNYVQRCSELSIRAERIIPAMETARDSHQYFVDNPDQTWWNVIDNQDGEWVIIYDEVIDILRAIQK